MGRFSREDREKIDESIAEAVKALETMLTEGADAAMNKYNRKKVAAHKPAQE